MKHCKYKYKYDIVYYLSPQPYIRWILYTINI